MKTAIIKASELGTNCWRPPRFVGSDCPYLEGCKYPEKKTCKAHTQVNYRVLVKRKLFADGRIVEEGSEKMGTKVATAPREGKE